jgi:hypothetical protein
MRKSDAMPSKYFRAKDLPDGWTLQAEVELARLEKFEGEGRGKESTEKMVVYFRRQKSALVVGSVIWDQIVASTGGEEDSDLWKGHVVELFKTTCQFGRETVDCIRVREASKKAAPKKAALKAAPKIVPPEEDEMAYDSDEAAED